MAEKEKLYALKDACDEDEELVFTGTLQEIRDWLADFWNNNPDEEMTDAEHEELIAGIKASEEDELFERVGGIGYFFEEVEGA